MSNVKMQIDSDIKEEPQNDSNLKSTCNNPNTNTNPPKTKPSNTNSRKRKLDCIEDIEMKDPNPPKKKRKKSRGWTEEEEKLFREGLDLYGRDWRKISSHVNNNRNPASIRSHAQVYFLNILKNGKTLPNKVLESGNGFTLSGKPLNKYSTAAIRHFGGAQNVPIIDGVISDQENAPKPRKKNNKSEKSKKPVSKPKKKKKKRKNKYYDSDSDEDYETISGISPTNSSTVTARRSGRNRKRVHFTAPPHESNPFGLRTDLQYYDEMIIENNDDKSYKKNKNKDDYKIYAPFKIEYCPNALLIADIHSHLLRSVEIMGLLGGIYDEINKILYVKKCYPLLEEQHDEHTVSASAIDQFNIREIITKDGFELVGWYHSHPCFENVPSNLDCYQHSMGKSDDEMKTPYVGLIVQSLWERGDGCSNFKWFNTIPLNRGVNDFEYMALQFMTKEKVFYDVSDDALLEQITALIKRYDGTEYDAYRTNLGENGIGKRIFHNIGYHLETCKSGIDDEEEEDNNEDNDQILIFVKKIEKLFMDERDIWWVTNKPKVGGDNDIDDKENENCLN